LKAEQKIHWRQIADGRMTRRFTSAFATAGISMPTSDNKKFNRIRLIAKAYLNPATDQTEN
jgi:hypothetical protein